jgi:hypothetical protein
MKHHIAVGLALVGVLSAPAVVHAEPLVPQPDTACSTDLAGALTQLQDLTTLLVCDGRWRLSDDPYPNSGRWLTYGPTLTLHGEAQRNREIDSGDWTGYPQDPDGRCTAEQVALASEGPGPPQGSTGEPGQPLRLRLQPLLFTVELSGFCLWQKG